MPKISQLCEPRTNSARRLSRRDLLRQGAALAVGSTLAWSPRRGWSADAPAPRLRLGLVTDLHYADKAPRGTRYYRDTPAKFAEAAKRFAQEKTDALIALGDLIDSAENVKAEKGYLRRVAAEFKSVPGPHYFVLGNHCVQALSKPEFLQIVGQDKSFYSFDLGGCHLVILDGCFRADGVAYERGNFKWTDAFIPPEELEWVRKDLGRTPHKTLVFVHQRLDVGPPLGVKNADEVRKVLEQSGRVLAVLQGHHHAGDCRQIAGIHYCTLRAMIEGSGPENNAYSVLAVLPGDAIRLTGYRRQQSYEWRAS